MAVEAEPMAVDSAVDAPTDAQDYDGAYTFVISNFLSREEKLCSEEFEIGGFVWNLLIFPKGNPGSKKVPAAIQDRSLAVYLNAPRYVNGIELPERKYVRHAKFMLTVINSDDPSKSVFKETEHRFYSREVDWGFGEMMRLGTIMDPTTGFLSREGSLHVRVDVKILRGPDYPGYDPRKETGCVGITNQGATCYLNSLLQTLYHIPAFRRAVYRIPTSEDEVPTSSISVALQHLFFRLQYADEAVDTKDLTKAFGWDTFEAFQQHDVQELARVLMDALENKMKNSPVEKDLAHLMEGKTLGVVECKNVEYKSERREPFLDIQLNVKGCASVYDSFDKLIEVDELVGDNKYDAEQHGMQDAIKYTKLESTPPVLFLHLKRFDFDLQALQQVKINDRFEFPSHLDLDQHSRKLFAESADPSVRNLYKLFSVLVHMGSMHGGHYFAYINPTGKQWLKFDDEKVVKVGEDEAIESQFGSSDGLGRGISRGSNAYMLVYVRESDWAKVFCEASEEDLPEHVQAMLRGHLEKERVESQEREEAHLYTSISIVTEDDLREQVASKAFGLGEVGLGGKKRRMRANTRFRDVVEMMEKELEVPQSRLRFWRFEMVSGSATDNSYRPRTPISEDKYDKEIGTLGHKVKSHTATSSTELVLFLETRKKDMPPGDVVLLFLKWFEPSSMNLSLLSYELFPNNTSLVTIADHLKRMKRLPDSLRISFWDEANEPRSRGYVRPQDILIGLKGTEKLSSANIRSGDVLVAQVRPENDRTPTVTTFAEWKMNQCTVTFQRLDNAKDEGVHLDMMVTDTYRQMAGKLAEHLGLPSWEHVRLYHKHSWTNKPHKQSLSSTEMRTIKELFPVNFGTCVADFFFYEPLEFPLREVEQMRTLRLVHVNERGEYEREVAVTCRHEDTMQTVMELGARELKLDPGRLRMMRVDRHKVHTLMRREEKVGDLQGSQWEYRIEVEPEEERPEVLKAARRTLVNVSHCTKLPRGQIDLSFWGEPVLVPVGASDTLSDIRDRAFRKMNITDQGAEDFKWYIVQMTKAEELAPTAAIGERLVRSQDLSENVLAVDHPDTRPLSKRRENNRGSYFRADGGIKIG